jgi:hypothetical protein
MFSNAGLFYIGIIFDSCKYKGYQKVPRLGQKRNAGLTYSAFSCSTTGIVMAVNEHWCTCMEDHNAFESVLVEFGIHSSFAYYKMTFCFKQYHMWLSLQRLFFFVV